MMDTRLLHLLDRVTVIVEKDMGAVNLLDERLPSLVKYQTLELPVWIAEALEGLGVVRIIKNRKAALQELTVKSHSQAISSTPVEISESFYQDIKNSNIQDSATLMGFVKSRLRIFTRMILSGVESKNEGALPVEEKIVMSRLKEFFKGSINFLIKIDPDWPW